MVRESEIEELIHSIEWRVEGDRIVFVVSSRTTRGRRYPVVVNRKYWKGARPQPRSSLAQRD